MFALLGMYRNQHFCIWPELEFAGNIQCLIGIPAGTVITLILLFFICNYFEMH